MTPKDMQTVLRQTADRMGEWEHLDSVPTIERDLVLDKLRMIYDALRWSGPPEFTGTPPAEPEEEPLSINLDDVLSVEVEPSVSPDDTISVSENESAQPAPEAEETPSEPVAVPASDPARSQEDPVERPARMPEQAGKETHETESDGSVPVVSGSLFPSLFGPEETEEMRRHRRKQRVLMALYDEDPRLPDGPSLGSEGVPVAETSAAAAAVDAPQAVNAETGFGEDADVLDISVKTSGTDNISETEGISGAEDISQTEDAVGADAVLETEDAAGTDGMSGAADTSEAADVVGSADASGAGDVPSGSLPDTEEADDMVVEEIELETAPAQPDPATFPGDLPEAAGPVPAEEVTVKRPLLGEIINQGVQTLGDALSQPAAADGVRGEPVAHLREAIGLNDKFLLIRDLFDGDAGAYEQAVDALNACTGLDDCLIYIAEHYAWNPNSDGAKRMAELLERKFS